MPPRPLAIGLVTPLALALAMLAALALGAPPREATAQSALVGDLQLLAQLYGDPPESGFARLRIPSIDVDAPVGARVVDLGAPVLPSPYGPADVAWYDLSAWGGLGGAPGETGNVILSGHVDYHANVPYADVTYRGPGVFSRLGSLEAGDIVELDVNGETLRYVVSWRQQVPAATGDWGAIFSSDVPVESLTLFTCTGDFDFTTRSYSDRIVVRAQRVIGHPRRFDVPEPGGYAWGTSGTNHAPSLVAAQDFEVAAVYIYDEAEGTWATYFPGAPAIADTISGVLQPDSFVIIKRK